jgi:polysaccharide pyruvyl transferase WcaK-like protein
MVKKKEKKFYLWGWSGQLNTGDDIFAHVVAWGLRRYMHGNQLFMDSDLSRVLSRRCRIHTAEPVCRGIPGLFRLRRAWFRHEADCFVLAGGTLLPTQKGTVELLADNHWCQPRRSRIAMGLSVGPFQSLHHEDSVAELLNSMEYVAFRDDFSYDWAVSRRLKTKLVRAFDLAVLLPECLATADVNRSQNGALGISLLAPEAQRVRARLPRDIDIARHVGASAARVSAKLGLSVVFFSLCLNSYSDDRVMARAFAEAFQGDRVELFEHNGDPVRTFEKVRSCSHMVSMRLHGGIMAFAAGVPFLQLEYHPKCRDFAKTIGLAEPHRLDMNDFSAEVFTRKLEGLMGCDSIVSAMDLRTAQERANLNFCVSAS